MFWLAWLAPPLLLTLAIAALLRRRTDLVQQERLLSDRVRALETGSHRARLLHPDIDLRKCIGCSACVRACPEDGVLAMSYGQAVVVHGARCVGHGRCAEVCPTGAIALTLGDISERRDLPAVDEHLEAVAVPGLFLAGEITGFALVRTAVQHGALVGREVARRKAQAAAGQPSRATPAAERELDLVIVGMGPAGLACALAAREQGLRFACLDQQEDLGGTVASYPRRKLVMTQPMELPLHGRLDRLEYEKEELVELWRRLATEHDLPITTSATVTGVHRDGATFVVESNRGTLRARNVCLAVGRRGTPRRLGVPGEDLPKVVYSLIDAAAYHDRTVLIVGGGDSAVEAALALAQQPGNCVTISYRRGAFFRLKSRNEERIRAAIDEGRVQTMFETEVVEIRGKAVVLRDTRDGDARSTQDTTLLNDEVFVFAGGTPPFPLLEGAGVSLDPALRQAAATAVDRGTGLLWAMVASLIGCVGLLIARHLNADYYDLGAAAREDSTLHELLRPQGSLGLPLGVGAFTLFLVNLLYLGRRSPLLGRLFPGTLRSWMSAHTATGLLALLLAVWHSAFHVGDAVAGHALLVMAVVVVAGVIGRWFYSFVPRIQNGKRADIEEVSVRVAAMASEWDAVSRGFGSDVRRRIEEVVAKEHFGRGFFGRVLALIVGQWHLQRLLARLRAEGRAQDVPPDELRHITTLARQAHRLALQLAHYDDLRSVLATWRWLHRWLALLLFILVVAHVVSAVQYGGAGAGLLRWFGGGS